MEAATPGSSPGSPPKGGRAGAIALLIVAALVGIFFAAVAITLIGTETCEEALKDAQSLLVECTEKSSGNKLISILLGAGTAIAAFALAWFAFASARAREMHPMVKTLSIVVVVGAVITILL